MQLHLFQLESWRAQTLLYKNIFVSWTNISVMNIRQVIQYGMLRIRVEKDDQSVEFRQTKQNKMKKK